MNSSECTRHLCVGDIIFSDGGAAVADKWSKTIQNKISTIIFIHVLGTSAQCPVKAIKVRVAVRHVHPGSASL